MAQFVNTTYNTARAVTKSDTDEQPQINGHYPTALWVGGAGIVVALMEDNTVAQFTCVAGSLLPVSFKRVNSTTTTATLMVALYQQ